TSARRPRSSSLRRSPRSCSRQRCRRPSGGPTRWVGGWRGGAWCSTGPPGSFTWCRSQDWSVPGPGGRMADPKGRHGFGVAPLSPDFLTELFQDPLDPGYADAAARRAQGRTRPPWQRRGLRSLTLITLVLVGMLLGVACRHVLAEEPDRTRARAELVERIHQREAEVERLREISDGLRDDVSRLRDLALDDSEVRRLRELEALTGLARVTGDGVVVRVADGPPVLDPGSGE